MRNANQFLTRSSVNKTNRFRHTIEFSLNLDYEMSQGDDSDPPKF
jgi:hypothetical protein